MKVDWALDADNKCWLLTDGTTEYAKVWHTGERYEWTALDGKKTGHGRVWPDVKRDATEAAGFKGRA